MYFPAHKDSPKGGTRRSSYPEKWRAETASGEQAGDEWVGRLGKEGPRPHPVAWVMERQGGGRSLVEFTQHPDSSLGWPQLLRPKRSFPFYTPTQSTVHGETECQPWKRA